MWTWQVHLTTRSCSNFNAGTFFSEFRTLQLCSPLLPPVASYLDQTCSRCNTKKRWSGRGRLLLRTNRGITCSKMQVVFFKFSNLFRIFIFHETRKRAKGKTDVCTCSTDTRKVSLHSGPLAVHENLEKSLSKTCRASLIEIIQKSSTTEGHKEMWPRSFAFKDRIHDSFHQPWNLWESVMITITKY